MRKGPPYFYFLLPPSKIYLPWPIRPGFFLPYWVPPAIILQQGPTCNYTGQNKMRLSTASLNLFCLIIFRLLMYVFNLQSCKSSSEWSNHEESVSASWSSHPISAAGEWLPWTMIYQPDMLTYSNKPIYMILFAGLIFCFIWFE